MQIFNRIFVKNLTIKMNENLRKTSFDKLKVFLANPGRFCLIVLGGRGVGKRYNIEQAFKAIQANNTIGLCLNNLVFIEADRFADSKSKINALFKANQNNTIVIEDVEDLNDAQQKLLFKALSTPDGRFGIGENFDLRILFTSSKDIDQLRTDNELLVGALWDRISQLIVEFPSYTKDNDSIMLDFRATWKKMNFEKLIGFEALAAYPNNIIVQKFMEDNAEKFMGGFRDLDKIACMYFNYRIFYYAESRKIEEEKEHKVVASIKADFFSKSQMQNSSDNDASVFNFEIGLKHDELLAKYKIQLRRWATKEYGSIAKAERKLGLGRGTMKNYVEGKATRKKNSDFDTNNGKMPLDG